MEIGQDNNLIIEKDKFYLFLFGPSNFFRKIQNESLWKAIFIYFIAGFFSLVVGSLVNLTSKLIYPKMFGVYFSFAPWLVGLIFLVIFFILFFIFGIFFHFFARVIFRGDAKYKDTMKVIFYSSLPIVAISFSIIGIIFVIYSFVLGIIGLSVVHNIGKVRAFFSIIFSTIIIGVLLFFFIYFLFSI